MWRKPLARERKQTRYNSGADSKVWMEEDVYAYACNVPWDYIPGNFYFERMIVMKIEVNKMVRMAILAALSIVLMMVVRFPIIPSAPFLIYEPADVPILISAFMFGPVAGLIVTLVVAVIQATLLSADGWIGFVMHMIATGTLVLVSGTIYRRFHSLKGAIAGLIAGALCMTLIMIPSNLFFTVRFYGVPYDTVKGMLLPAIIPFNLIKSFTNSIIVLIVYKSLSKIIKGFDKMTAKKA